jgi:hypothetical protein
MKDLIIRDLDDALLVALKRKAWHQGLPLEESLRRLLLASIAAESEAEEHDSFMPPPRLGAPKRISLYA